VFEEGPTFPTAFVIYDRKIKAVHFEFFEESYKQWVMMKCWNHILRDIEMVVKRHEGKGCDVAVYKSYVRELLNCRSVVELTTKMSTLEPTWSEAFKTYYNSHLVNRVEKAYAGYLHSVGLQTSSITTNMSEALNFVIKEFQGWKENTADICLLSLYHLQLYYKTHSQCCIKAVRRNTNSCQNKRTIALECVICAMLSVTHMMSFSFW